MTDEQVRDEAMTLLLAGHETTANALTWTLVSPQPESPTPTPRLHDELDRVLGGRTPSPRDLPDTARTRRRVVDRSRCGCIRRRGSSAAAPSTSIPLGDYERAAAGDRLHEPVRDAARRALLRRSRALRSRSMDARIRGRLAEVRLLPVWWRRAPMHRRTVRVDGGGAGRWPRSRSGGASSSSPAQRIVPQPLVTLRAKHGMKMRVTRSSADR